MTLKERFETIARTHIKREGLEKLLSHLALSDFYIAPASTKYHDSVPEGLVAHSLKVFSVLDTDLNGDDTYSMESKAIVALFHDICKTGYYKVETRNTKDEKGKWIQVPYYTVDDKFPVGHSEKSIIMLQEFMKLTGDEILAINSHMGGFDKRQDIIGKCFALSPLAVHLHIADLKATYLD